MNANKVFSGSRPLVLIRRDAREDACDGLEYSSAIVEAVADVAGDVNSIPIIGQVAGIVTGCVAAVAHVTKAGMAVTKTALKCDDIPFEEIKDIMNKRFNELERRQGLNSEAMNKVSEMVSKTYFEVERVRADMNKGFNKVVEEIQYLSTKASITQIHNIVDYFNNEKERIRSLSKDEYVSKLEENDGILQELRDHRTSKTGSLHTAIYEILENREAIIPQNADDTKAFQTLYALYYAAQSYVAIFGFLMESHSFLADYHYEQGNYEEFNEQVDKIKSIFDEFKVSLVKQNYGVLKRVKLVLEKIREKPFVNNIKNSLFKEMCQREKSLNKLITQIMKMDLPVIKDTPPTAIPVFKIPDYKTPLGEWKNGIKVRYAVQYESKGMFSKLSPWSENLDITNKASPIVKVKVDPEGRRRLVFRQINGDIPQLVGILANPKTEFRDINRDLYNAAGVVDRQLATDNVRKLIENGADVNALFEQGRSAMHRAAATGNKDVMNLLLNNGFRDINLKDNKGYTPLHLAAEFGTKGFIPELISKGANVDPTTNEDNFTPLHLASKNGFGATVAELVTRTKNINAKDNNGYMPLHYGVNAGRKVLDKFFQFHKASNVAVNAKSEAGLTALHLAAIKGVVSAITALDESNVLDPNVGDSNGMTPLHFAAMLGTNNVIKKLVKVELININAAAKKNMWTPLHYAIYFKQEDAVKMLLQSKDLKINSRAEGGITPLHFAVMTDQIDLVIELLRKEAKLNIVTDEGYTALHLAAMLEDGQIASLLIQEGANMEAKSKANETPLDIAKKFGNTDTEDAFPTARRFRRRFEVSKHDHAKSANSFIKEPSYQHTNYLLKEDDPGFDHGSEKLGAGAYSFERLERSSFQNIDPIGTLLMLDLILRKITKESYGFFAGDTESNLDNAAMALKITEKFEGLLKSLSDSPIINQIDLSEIHSKVKKALRSGNESKIANILCFYAKKVSSLNLNEFRDANGNSNTKAFTSESHFIDKIHNLVENVCEI